ncbi:MAG TPA: pseudouridine synthase [Acidimicrobiales bacterium]|nr:pseudouridine synthase [Acidimicrobiales bacterium]
MVPPTKAADRTAVPGRRHAPGPCPPEPRSRAEPGRRPGPGSPLTARPGSDTEEPPRLQKVLARAGLGSRRACEELIASGRVTVDGRTAVLGQRVDPASSKVALDGVPVPVAPGLVHYLLNKPAGVVTTASDPQGRPTVVALVPARPRVFPVGRLDLQSEGLLILTNDGQLAQLLAHPSHGVPKEYVAEVAGTPSPGALRALRRGVELEDGRTAPATVGVLAPGVLRIVVHEGRNRLVRRMCEAVGHPVRRLVRTRIGPVADPSLPPGAWRLLSPREVRALAVAATGGSSARRSRVGGRGRPDGQ